MIHLRKSLFTLVVCFCSAFAFAQFGIVIDKDGYSNIRDSANLNEKIIDWLRNGHLVFGFETKGNWINIGYAKKNKDKMGWIYHDRIKLVTEYPSFREKSQNENQIILVLDSITIIVSQQKFNRVKYKFSYYKDSPGNIEFINGKQYWGTDGEQPKREYGPIQILQGKKKIILPKRAVDNLFEPTLGSVVANYDEKNDILYIQSSNSDGAGYYEVIWKIERGVYKDRYIVYGF